METRPVTKCRCCACGTVLDSNILSDRILYYCATCFGKVLTEYKKNDPKTS